MLPRIFRSVVSLSREKPSNVCGFSSIYPISIRLFSSSPSRKLKWNVSLWDYLINQHGFSPEVALKASTAKIIPRKPECTDLLLSYFKETGFTKTQIERIIFKFPRVLSADLEKTVKPKIKVFEELGFPQSDMVDAISTDPWILGRSADNQIGPSLAVLKKVLGSHSLVSKVVKVCGSLLKYDLEKTLVPNIELLKSYGVSYSQIVSYVVNFPRLFVYTPENIKDFVRRVDEMGFDKSSRMFIVAVVVMSSMTEKNWKLKLKVFRDLGFSYEDIGFAFRRVPQAFAVSEKKIKEGAEILLGLEKVDVSYLVKHTELLICSVQKRLKPRLEVLDILERKDLIKNKPSLTTLFKLSEKKFWERYVVPYLAELVNTSLVRRACVK